MYRWQLQRIALYQRRKKIRSLDTTEFLDRLVFINKPHWQSSGIITFLCKYDIVIPETLVGFFLNVLFLLLQDYHSFMRNEEGIKIELQKKVHRRICVRHVTFFDFTRSFLCHFLLPYSFTTFPKWRTYWMVPIKIHIALGGNLCYAEKMKISCNLILYLQTCFW